MQRIKLTQSKYALVDDADFDWLNQWNWHYAKVGYAMRNVQAKPKHIVLSMHTMIMNTPKGFEVDHKNRNKLDNRRCNLRVVNRSINSHNKDKQSNNTSGVKGVYWAKWANMWRVMININGKTINVGYFKEIDEAARARKSIEMEHGLCV